MRRALATFALIAAAAAAVVGLGADGGDSKFPRYWVELDTAFGVVEGGDVRVAGVNAGTVREIKLDEKTLKALVEIEITQTGFGTFRTDTFCETRPQSPLGEYFIDCDPGTARTDIPEGGRVKVEQTTTTIPNDLVTNVWRRPYRERLRLILAEFGAGLAGRGEDLNAAIRRAVPALRQTDRVLAILADHNQVIRELVEDADTIFEEVAGNKEDVGRFVEEARDTNAASAERRDDLATNWRELPPFLGELEPTLARLETLTEEQTPVLQDLNASAGQLRRFFDNTAEFSHASRPSIRALADAAEVGRPALRAAAPQIKQLRSYAGYTPDVAKNARILLEDFGDPSRAVERDSRAPNGQRGFSGLQAIFRYIFSQSLQVNGFDLNGYFSRAAVHTGDCAPYADAKTVKDEPELTEQCKSWLGPNQLGVTTPDPTNGGAIGERTPPRGTSLPADREPEGKPPVARVQGGGGGGGNGGGSGGGRGVLGDVEDALGGGPDPRPGGSGSAPSDPGVDFLDFLLGP